MKITQRHRDIAEINKNVSTERILKEIKVNEKLNTEFGPHPDRDMAIDDLKGILAIREESI